MKIKIQILAEDIRTSDYTNNTDCAIARAVKRILPLATKFAIGGDNITNYTYNEYIIMPKELNDLVCGMYANLIPESWKNEKDLKYIEPQDFEYELDIPDHWIK